MDNGQLCTISHKSSSERGTLLADTANWEISKKKNRESPNGTPQNLKNRIPRLSSWLNVPFVRLSYSGTAVAFMLQRKELQDRDCVTRGRTAESTGSGEKAQGSE